MRRLSRLRDLIALDATIYTYMISFRSIPRAYVEPCRHDYDQLLISAVVSIYARASLTLYAFRTLHATIDIAICYHVRLYVTISLQSVKTCAATGTFAEERGFTRLCREFHLRFRNSLDDVRHPAVEQGLIDAILRESNKTADIPTRHAAVSSLPPLIDHRASGVHASFRAM